MIPWSREFSKRSLKKKYWRKQEWSGALDRRTFNKLAGAASVGAITQFGEKPTLWALGESRSQSNQPEDAARISVAQSPWDRYLFGTAYYSEWWEPSEWETDFRQMRDVGINTVRMGEFAWASYEPEPGKLNFSWMDRAIEIANHHGVNVVLGTPTASVPPWLYQMHPDVLSANDLGPYSVAACDGRRAPRQCPYHPGFSGTLRRRCGRRSKEQLKTRNGVGNGSKDLQQTGWSHQRRRAHENCGCERIAPR